MSAGDPNWNELIKRARAACEEVQLQIVPEDECDPYDASITIAGNRFCTGEVLRLLQHIEEGFAR